MPSAVLPATNLAFSHAIKHKFHSSPTAQKRHFFFSLLLNVPPLLLWIHFEKTEEADQLSLIFSRCPSLGIWTWTMKFPSINKTISFCCSIWRWRGHLRQRRWPTNQMPIHVIAAQWCLRHETRLNRSFSSFTPNSRNRVIASNEYICGAIYKTWVHIQRGKKSIVVVLDAIRMFDNKENIRGQWDSSNWISTGTTACNEITRSYYITCSHSSVWRRRTPFASLSNKNDLSKDESAYAILLTRTQ